MRDDNRQLFKAVCDQCGKTATLPFKPTGDKPVYCSDCFEQRSGSRGGDRRSRRDSRRDFRRDKQLFDVICDSCGKKAKVPFKPSGDKPIYCDDCFASKGGSRRPNQAAQIEEINAKLELIMNALKIKMPREKETKKEVKKQAEKKAEPKKKAAKKKTAAKKKAEPKKKAAPKPKKKAPAKKAAPKKKAASKKKK